MQCGAAMAGPATCEPGAAPADPLRDRVAGFMDSWFFGARRGEVVLDAATLAGEVSSGKPVFLLDVREPSEFEAGHIEGAQNLSVRELDSRLGEIRAAKDARVVTVCRSGKRSGWAAMYLRVAGYHDVRSLDGGMLAWSAAGLPSRTGAER